MNKLLLICVLILTFHESFTQYNPPISRSRFYNNKYSTFTIKPGDILLYTIAKDTQLYNIHIMVKRFADEIELEYNLPAHFSTANISSTGSINIPSEVVNEGIKYESLLDTSQKNSKKGNIFWLSKKNYIELVEDHISTLDVGNGEEDFVRKNTSTMKINYKGREKIITVYNFDNRKGEIKKAIAVLTDEKNPLIVKMNAGWTMTLKEVR